MSSRDELGPNEGRFTVPMLPQCTHMPYLGPAHPLQGATLGADFSDSAKNGLGEKWSFDLHETQVWGAGADNVASVSAYVYVVPQLSMP